jgi:sirohydrochlorin cobaltochelatase
MDPMSPLISDRPLLLIVGHGSRGVGANVEFEQLVALYQQRRPEFEIRYGYIEIAQPLLPDALAALGRTTGDITLLPLFLFAAGHVKKDIPAALATARRDAPGLRFRTARELGVHPALVNVTLERAESVLPPEGEASQKPTVVIVGRGSSDPDANDDFRKVARLLAQSGKFQDVLPCFVGISQPRFEETLEMASRSRPEQMLVVPYFLFRGRLLTQIQEQVATFRTRHLEIKIAIAPHLGVTEQLLAVMDERVDEVIRSEGVLPGNNC